MCSAFEGDFQIETFVHLEEEEDPIDQVEEYCCLWCDDRQKELVKRGSRHLIGGTRSSD